MAARLYFKNTFIGGRLMKPGSQLLLSKKNQQGTGSAQRYSGGSNVAPQKSVLEKMQQYAHQGLFLQKSAYQ